MLLLAPTVTGLTLELPPPDGFHPLPRVGTIFGGFGFDFFPFDDDNRREAEGCFPPLVDAGVPRLDGLGRGEVRAEADSPGVGYSASIGRGVGSKPSIAMSESTFVRFPAKQ